MILSFKKQFKEKILDGTKIHTIREDSRNRWRKRNLIHFATDVRTPNYDCFKEGKCVSVQRIHIRWYTAHGACVYMDWNEFYYKQSYMPTMVTNRMLELARNDGFESINDFFRWFNKDFDGKIIHWTKFRYHMKSSKR